MSGLKYFDRHIGGENTLHLLTCAALAVTGMGKVFSALDQQAARKAVLSLWSEHREWVCSNNQELPFSEVVFRMAGAVSAEIKEQANDLLIQQRSETPALHALRVTHDVLKLVQHRMEYIERSSALLAKAVL